MYVHTWKDSESSSSKCTYMYVRIYVCKHTRARACTRTQTNTHTQTIHTYSVLRNTYRPTRQMQPHESAHPSGYTIASSIITWYPFQSLPMLSSLDLWALPAFFLSIRITFFSMSSGTKGAAPCVCTCIQSAWDAANQMDCMPWSCPEYDTETRMSVLEEGPRWHARIGWTRHAATKKRKPRYIIQCALMKTMDEADV